jgi:NAD(P)-dependent dehydrogenase (short-subunit alcohol dehydrogenase family)
MEMNMSELDGKFFLVTGGNSGIGLATAHALAEAGAKLAIFGREAATLDKAASTIGRGTIAVKGDVSKLADLDRLYADIGSTGRKLDGVFVNAGIAQFPNIGDVTEAWFDQMMAVNVKGAYFTVQKALPHLNDGGSIVFTSTVAWHQGMPGASVYAATKAALVGLTKTLAGELAPRKIRVNTVSPGPIRTPISGRMGIPEEHALGFMQMLAAKTMAGRVGEGADVGYAVRFLLSDEASYINGVEIPVDGGYLLGKLG